MVHEKRYIGHSVGLYCNGALIVDGESRFANFSLTCPFCGAQLETTGTSPETDVVIESRRDFK